MKLGVSGASRKLGRAVLDKPGEQRRRPTACVVLMSVAGTREAPEISVESAGRVGGPLGRGTAYSITRKHRQKSSFS
jgi:hypothetical protein